MQIKSYLTHKRFAAFIDAAVIIVLVLIGTSIIFDCTSVNDAIADEWDRRAVTWVDVIGAAVDENNTLFKTSGTGSSSSAASLGWIPGEGGVEFRAEEVDTIRTCGLSKETMSSTRIEYGIYLDYTEEYTTNVMVYESGYCKGEFGGYNSGDLFSVERRNGIVEYFKNGILFYTSDVLSSGDLFVDTSLYTFNATIADCYLMGPNTPPLVPDQAIAASINTPKEFTLKATDPQEDSLEYYVLTYPSHGILSGTAPNLTYTPDTDFKGKDSFTFKAFDGELYSDIATVYIYMWTAPERIDVPYGPYGPGTDPTLSYAPDGDLRTFYNAGDADGTAMVVRTRLSGQTGFSDEVFIYDNAHSLDIHYDDSGVIDLAVDDRFDDIIVLKSLDSGDTWDVVTIFPSRDGPTNTDVFPLAFTEDDTDIDLRLFYTFRHYFSSPFAYTWPKIYYRLRNVDGTWGSEVVLEEIGKLAKAGAYEKGDKITVSPWYHSTDNGENYEGVSAYGDDMKVGPGGRLYLLTALSKQVVFKYSDDDGTTWTEFQEIKSSDRYCIAPRFAINGSQIVVVWTEQMEGDSANPLLKCVVSENAGATWSPAHTLLALEEPRQIEAGNYGGSQGRGVDIENNGSTFTVAYSVIGGGDLGVYIMEFDPWSQSPAAPVLESIGDKCVEEGVTLEFTVRATDTDGDVLSFSHPEAGELPQGASFIETWNAPSIIETQFNWTPEYGQADDYPLLFEASDGALTASETIQIHVTPLTMPSAPTNLIANAVSSSQINLVWQDNSNNEDGFKIERKIEGGAFELLDTVGRDAATYSDIDLELEAAYCYRVRAYNSKGDSDYSNQASSTTLPEGAQTPWMTNENGNLETGVAVQVGTYGYEFTPLANGYIRKLGGFFNGTGTVYLWKTSTAQLLAQVEVRSSNCWSYSDINPVNVQANESYTVGVYIDNGGVASARREINTLPQIYEDIRIEQGAVGVTASGAAMPTIGQSYQMSGQVDIVFVPGDMPLTAPTNLTAIAISSSEINLTWDDNSVNELGFKIERRPEGGSFQERYITGQNVTTYLDTGLDSDSTYYYQVRAYNLLSDSGYSNEAYATTLPDLPENNPPRELVNRYPYIGETDVCVADVMLGWAGGDSDSGDTVTYDIYFEDDPSPAWIANTAAPGSVTDVSYGPLNQLDYNTTYYWYINATDSYGNYTTGDVWNFTTEAEDINYPPYPAHTPDPDDGQPNVSVIGTILSWLSGGDPDEDYLSYDVYFGNQTASELLIGNTTELSFGALDGLLACNTTYHWRVDTWDEHGAGALGNEWDFTTELFENDPPPIPGLAAPLNGATGIPIIDTALEWIGVIDPEGNDVYYDLYLGSHTNPSLFAGNLTDVSYVHNENTFAWHDLLLER